MTTKGLDDILYRFKEDHQKCKELLLSMVQNEALGQDERWRLYMKYGELLLSIDPYYFDPDGLNWDNLTLFDDFYCDKYETMTVDNMTKRIEEKGFEVDWNLYKESWMQKGIWGFKNDW